MSNFCYPNLAIINVKTAWYKSNLKVYLLKNQITKLENKVNKLLNYIHILRHTIQKNQQV